MIKYINKHNNLFALLTGLLSVAGLLSHWLLDFNMSALLFLSGGIIGGVPIFIKAIQALKVKVVSIDLLVSIAIIGGLFIGEFEEAAIVSFLFLFGDYLEQKTLKKTRQSIRELVESAPKQANLKLSNGEIKKVATESLKVDDHVIVKAGGQIPADGLVFQGQAYINQAAITGESKLVGVKPKDQVYSGSLLDNGHLEIQVTRVGEETTLGKIIELVEEAQDSKSPVEKFIDQFSKYYTPAVLIIGILTFLLSRDIKLAITILVLGCPGALVIGTPVSMVAGIGNGANKGVLLQGGNIVSEMAKIKTFVFDKTNTLTKGEMTVSFDQVYIPLTAMEKSLVASMENQSDHPIAKILKTYLNIPIQEINVETIKGQGLKYQSFLVGNEKLLAQHQIKLSLTQQKDLAKIQGQGATTVLIAIDQQLKEIIGISDTLKETAKTALDDLRQLGARQLAILSGDNQLVVNHVAQQLQVDQSYGELLPEDKLTYVKRFQKANPVAFVGDGINDSPSIAAADIGISMGNGTDVAIETSDIVLANASLKSLVYAYALCQKIMSNVKQNIFISILTVVLLLIGLLFGVVNMASGMLFHELSILIVIGNAMRLIKFNNLKH